MNEIKQWDVVAGPDDVLFIVIDGPETGFPLDPDSSEAPCTFYMRMFSPFESRSLTVTDHFSIREFRKIKSKVAMAPAMISERHESTRITRRDQTSALYTFEEFEFTRHNYSTENLTWSWPYSITSLVIVDKS